MPFTWAYDASNLTDGADAFNQFVYLLGGYGDFVLRRVVGISRCLAPTGTYQIRRRDASYIQQGPIIGGTAFADGGGADDLMILPEEIYPELGSVRFDLTNILRGAPSGALPDSAQIAFQGARRLRGVPVVRPGFRADPRAFCYQQKITVETAPVTVYKQINDYDFELYDIRMVLQQNAFLRLGIEDQAKLIFSAVVGGVSAVTIAINHGGAPLTPLSITVVGMAITIQPETDGAGVAMTTGDQLLALYTATPAAVALARLTVDTMTGTGEIPDTLGVATPLAGNVNAPLSFLNGPVSKLTFYDWNRVAISNVPILDLFYDGSPKPTQGPPGRDGSVYGDGAVQPPLYYPKDSQIRVDCQPLAGVTDFTLEIQLWGRQYYPC